MGFLASFRNRESQYLQPLMGKASDVLDAAASPPQFPPPTEETADASQVDEPPLLG
jgi:hypothetical protein